MKNIKNMKNIKSEGFIFFVLVFFICIIFGCIYESLHEVIIKHKNIKTKMK